MIHMKALDMFEHQMTLFLVRNSKICMHMYAHNKQRLVLPKGKKRHTFSNLINFVNLAT